MKTPMQPALAASVQEFIVIGEVNAGLGKPLLSQFRLCHGTEQVLGAGDVLPAGADEIVVHHQHMLFIESAEIPAPHPLWVFAYNVPR